MYDWIKFWRSLKTVVPIRAIISYSAQVAVLILLVVGMESVYWGGGHSETLVTVAFFAALTVAGLELARYERQPANLLLVVGAIGLFFCTYIKDCFFFPCNDIEYEDVQNINLLSFLFSATVFLALTALWIWRECRTEWLFPLLPILLFPYPGTEGLESVYAWGSIILRISFFIYLIVSGLLMYRLRRIIIGLVFLMTLLIVYVTDIDIVLMAVAVVFLGAFVVVPMLSLAMAIYWLIKAWKMTEAA